MVMTRPRIKPEHAPYRIAGSRIRLGGVVYGTAAEVMDPTGAIWTLLRAMDGAHDVDQVVARVLLEHPQESAEAVRHAIDQFVDAGYVEDAGAPVPADLTERDTVRHGRSVGYFRWMDTKPRASSWDPQVALRRAAVTVLGLGGSGGTAAMALAAAGTGRLTCVDDDTVELSNLGRQVLFTEDDIGMSKVDAGLNRLRRLNSDIEIRGVRQRVVDVDQLKALASDCDVLVLAADTPNAIRRWTNRACLATFTPWVDTGYHGPLVAVGVYVPGTGPCHECLRAAEADRRAADGTARRAADGTATEDGPAATTHAVGAPSAGLSGFLAAHYAIALITGVPAVEPGRLHTMNLIAPQATETVAGQRRPDCPACGARS